MRAVSELQRKIHINYHTLPLLLVSAMSLRKNKHGGRWFPWRNTGNNINVFYL